MVKIGCMENNLEPLQNISPCHLVQGGECEAGEDPFLHSQALRAFQQEGE